MEKFICCRSCGKQLFYENEVFEQDDAFELEDDEILCSDCFWIAAREKFYKKLIVPEVILWKEDY